MHARLASILLFVAVAATAQTLPPQQLVPVSQGKAPVVDGNLKEWGIAGWSKIAIKPAVDKTERSKLGLEPEDKNFTGSITVELKALAAGGMLYIAARWPDDAADIDFRPWEWRGGKYSESAKRDDMFAMRFPLEGEFDRSMLSGKSYKADVWLWSAGRSNPAGLAEDMTHTVTTRHIEDVAEYQVQGVGTVYIRKQRDAGKPVYRNLRPAKDKTLERLPSVELTRSAEGSIADVAAKGVWHEGHWNLELARKLNTGNADDAVFRSGQKVSVQIAVFNRSSDEHKSVSEIFVLDFGAGK